ncbi:hypothetical protein LRAMOSA09054 [Lichtheimia ramosa]|uniref:RING-type domain-containing protein n=1 Tax=Lichtheimia ramosa TaxID=688394 RepID=A0A077WFZ2_9FUNG|nr:hypothetical protein LRAMOSA09054 [Lichtheimia ramosa]
MSQSVAATPSELPDTIAGLLTRMMKELQCPICLQPITEATSTPCGHTFCRACIQRWLKYHTQCPCCVAKLHRRVLYESDSIDRIVTEFGKLRQAYEDETHQDLSLVVPEQYGKEWRQEPESDLSLQYPYPTKSSEQSATCDSEVTHVTSLEIRQEQQRRKNKAISLDSPTIVVSNRINDVRVLQIMPLLMRQMGAQTMSLVTQETTFVLVYTDKSLFLVEDNSMYLQAMHLFSVLNWEALATVVNVGEKDNQDYWKDRSFIWMAQISVELAHISQMLSQIHGNNKGATGDQQVVSNQEQLEAIADQSGQLAKEIRDAIYKYAVVDVPGFDKVFAYEVDGYGSRLMMDDANVPSLLSLPMLGFVDANDPVYQNTRKLVLSRANPYYFDGPRGSGIGGPHIGINYAWPMSQIVRILTSSDDNEIKEALDIILHSTDKTGLVHESFNVYDKKDPGKDMYTRSWFAWANGLFGQAILKIAKERPHLIMKQ